MRDAGYSNDNSRAFRIKTPEAASRPIGLKACESQKYTSEPRPERRH